MLQRLVLSFLKDIEDKETVRTENEQRLLKEPKEKAKIKYEKRNSGQNQQEIKVY